MRNQFIGIALLLFSMVASAQQAERVSGLNFVETADGNRSVKGRELVQWTHTRLVFNKPLDRVAVGQNDILEVEILSPSEILILAKSVGRTSIIVWYPDDTTETFLFGVNTDLSVLREALADIHPNIIIELAPDRAALVLRGLVPTVNYRIAAENAARNYLNAEKEVVSTNATTLTQSGAADLISNITNPGMTGRASGSTSSIAIINLVQVEQLPMSSKDKIAEAIAEIGGENVNVRRIRRGDVNSDAEDSLLLSGTVQTQIDLVRVLNVASRLFTGSEDSFSEADSVKVLANESGSLIDEQQQSNNAGALGILGGGNGSGLNNAIKSNIGRAKLLSSANGRILSMIEVLDLPQVRVSVQMYEVSRTRMKNWRPDLALVSQDYLSNSGSANGSGLAVQPDASERIGASGSQVANALQIIGGSLSNQFQIGNNNAAFDLLFSLLEQEGISRTLSKPTLTVLAGEEAIFQIGGEVPIPSAYAPAGISNGDSVGSNTSGVFSGTEFRAFGVQLMVRPMVGEDDRITIDVNPTISMPDTSLTQTIAGATGSNLNTTAFNTRSLNTTTRLRDGQPLVIGGLVSKDISDNKGFTPGLNKVPVLGKLAESSAESDTDKELIIILTPSIIREPSENTALWAFPSSKELMQTGIGMSLYMGGASTNTINQINGGE